MNELHQAIYQKIVAPELAKRKHSTKGRIILYDNLTNRAIIEWIETGVTMTKAGVPVTFTGGASTSGPFPGDMVWLEFANGNSMTPKVVGLIDETYESNVREGRMKHERKGAFVPDVLDGK